MADGVHILVNMRVTRSSTLLAKPNRKGKAHLILPTSSAPNFADLNVDAAFVDSMAVIKPLAGLGMLAAMKTELHAYLAAAKGAGI